MDMHGDALKKIVGDMDDMESKKMYPNSGGGATITISIAPGTDSAEDGQEPDEDDSEIGDLPADHDEAMCKGGCAMHKGGLAMAGGGAVPQPSPMAMPMTSEEDEMKLPPFLRKKRPM